ncbi:MAG: hypothetical protein D6812_11390, partial [Deltaproteobacteria bacterium]
MRLCYACEHRVEEAWKVCPACSARLKLGERFRIEGELGSGAQSVVYKGVDLTKSEDEFFVLKVAKGKHRFFGEVSLLEHEYDCLCKIDNPNIIKAYEYGEIEGCEFILMEWFEGEPLNRRIRQAGLFDMLTAMSIARQICHALEGIHEIEVVHRDIKLKNILVNDANEIKLIDLGIASRQDGGLGTYLGFIGTREYAAPEQFLQKGVDVRTDIYSFGIVLYFLFTGRFPFDRETKQSSEELMHFHLHEPPPPPSTFNPRIKPMLDRLILKCLAKEKEGRYQTIQDVAQALEAAQQEYSSQSNLPSMRPPSAFLPERSRFSEVDSDFPPPSELPPTEIEQKETVPGSYAPLQPITPISASPRRRRLLGVLGAIAGVALGVFALIYFTDLRLWLAAWLLGSPVAGGGIEIGTPPVERFVSSEGRLHLFTDRKGRIVGVVTSRGEGPPSVEGKGKVTLLSPVPPELPLARPLIWRTDRVKIRSEDFVFPFELFHQIFLESDPASIEVCFGTRWRCARVRLPPGAWSHPTPLFSWETPFPLPPSGGPPGLDGIVPYPQRLALEVRTEEGTIVSSDTEVVTSAQTWRALLAQWARHNREAIAQAYVTGGGEAITVTLEAEFAGETLRWGTLHLTTVTTVTAWDCPSPRRCRFTWLGPPSAHFELHPRAMPETQWHIRNVKRERLPYRTEFSPPPLRSLTSLSARIDAEEGMGGEFLLLTVEAPTGNPPTFRRRARGQIELVGEKTLSVTTYIPVDVTVYVGGRRRFTDRCADHCLFDLEKALAGWTERFQGDRLDYEVRVNGLPVARFPVVGKQAPSPSRPTAKPKGQGATPTPAAPPPACPKEMIDFGRFCIDRYEFTVGVCHQIPECRQFLKDETYLALSRKFPEIAWKEPDAPLVSVKFEEAERFCRLRLGARGRLPTVAEWQRAAQGIEQLDLRTFNILGSAEEGPRLRSVHALGKDVSRSGLVGMGGNVSEWASGKGQRPYACGKGFDESAA